MSLQLVNHNPDLSALVDKGYAVDIDSNYLIVRDIPYLDQNKKLQTGVIVTKLVFCDEVKVKLHDHQIFFAGGVPHDVQGNPIAGMGGGPVPAGNVTLSERAGDVVVERRFSVKRIENGNMRAYVNFHEKIATYASKISSPALQLYPNEARMLTFRTPAPECDDPVFKINDTLTSRAEIGDLAQVFREEVVAIIGLGGTGSYVLDFIAKTPVPEIRAFDGDEFYVHNVFRAPGRFEKAELDTGKAAVMQARYENLRHGLSAKTIYIDAKTADELDGVTFAFVCVDNGDARGEIADILLAKGIPFLDVGMGLDRRDGPLSGKLRVTDLSGDDPGAVRARGYMPDVEDPANEYNVQIQISELNALNAALAVIMYKQRRGFYFREYLHGESESENLLFKLHRLKTTA